MPSDRRRSERLGLRAGRVEAAAGALEPLAAGRVVLRLRGAGPGERGTDGRDRPVGSSCCPCVFNRSGWKNAQRFKMCFPFAFQMKSPWVRSEGESLGHSRGWLRISPAAEWHSALRADLSEGARLLNMPQVEHVSLPESHPQRVCRRGATRWCPPHHPVSKSPNGGRHNAWAPSSHPGKPLPSSVGPLDP